MTENMNKQTERVEIHLFHNNLPEELIYLGRKARTMQK